MVKLVYALRRREDISKEEFSRYWLDEDDMNVVASAAGVAVTVVAV